MDYQITGERLISAGAVYDGSVEQPIDLDFSLPDYCPDVGRILRCAVEPYIRSRKYSDGAIRLDGSARINLIYVDERDGAVQSCANDMPFSAVIKAPGLPPECRITACARTDYVNCRATGPRRVDLHGSFTLSVRVTAPIMQDFLSEASGEDLRVRKAGLATDSYVGCTQQGFTLSETLELPSGKPSAASVICSSCEVVCTDCKAIANKLITKGEALLRLTYRAEGSGNTERMEYIIPFSQFFDLTGVDDECKCTVSMEISSLDVGVRTNIDGEYRRFSVVADVFADLRAYRPVSLDAVSDAYSTDYGLLMEKKQLELSRLCDRPSKTLSASVSIPTGDFTAVKINEGFLTVGEINAVRNGSAIKLSVSVTASAIAENEDGRREFFEASDELAAELPYNGGCEDIAVTAESIVRSVTFEPSRSGGIEVGGEAELRLLVFEKERVQTVSSIAPDVNSPKPADMPAVTIYFAEKGEQLWDIARELGSSVESIMLENSLEGETVEAPCRLLISM